MLSHTLDEISHAAKKLCKSFGCCDPVRICRASDIILIYKPLGSCDGCCKGYFFTAFRKKAIIVNNSLSEQEQKIIIAHELGHAILHSKGAEMRDFHEFYLLDETNVMEYEANVFAAELLIDEDKLLERVKGGWTYYQLAADLKVPYELLAFKIRVLNRKGCNLPEPPVYVQADFLKKRL